MYATPLEQKRELNQRLLALGLLIALLLFIGTITYHFSEGWSYIDSLYFSTISLTTRGFSSLQPTNWFSVLFSVFYLLIGVALVIYALSTLIAYYTSFYQDRVKAMVGKLKKQKPKKWVVLKPQSRRAP